MPREQVVRVKLPLHKNHLLPGRLVKTKTFTNKLITAFDKEGLIKYAMAPDREIKGWCNLNFSVHLVNGELVTLKYNTPHGGTYQIDWPIAGLSVSYGVRI